MIKKLGFLAKFGLVSALALSGLSGCAPRERVARETRIELPYSSIGDYRISNNPNYKIGITYVDGGSVVGETMKNFRTVEQLRDGSYEIVGVSKSGLTLGKASETKVKVGDTEIRVLGYSPILNSVPLEDIRRVLEVIQKRNAGELDGLEKALD